MGFNASMISAYPEAALHSYLGDLLCISGVMWKFIFDIYNTVLGDLGQ